MHDLDTIKKLNQEASDRFWEALQEAAAQHDNECIGLWTPGEDGKPYLPMDCNPDHDDQGMDVFFSHEACLKACDYLGEFLGLTAEPLPVTRKMIREIADSGGNF
jgi:hypothetical protein